MEVEYNLFLHWKQGDDFNKCLEETDGNVSKAFKLWASNFKLYNEICNELANIFEGKDIKADADTHHISFYGDEDILEKAVDKKLINKDLMEE